MKKLILMALATLALAACGGDGPKDDKKEDKKVDYNKLELTPQSEGALVRANEDELLQHINNGLRLQVSGTGGSNVYLREFATAAPQANADNAGGGQSNKAESSGSGFSETNVHVKGVDEADYAKYDGRHWYIATQPSGGLNISNRKPGLKIYSTDPAVPDARAIGKYAFDDKWGSVGEIYPVSKEGETSHIASLRYQWGNVRPWLPGRGIAISNFGGIAIDVAGGGVLESIRPAVAPTPEPALGAAVDETDSSGTTSSAASKTSVLVLEEGEDNTSDEEPAARLIAPDIWPGPTNSSVRVELVDVENPNNPQGDWSIEIDGSIIKSRKVGNMLYLVSRFDPWVRGLIYERGNPTAREDNEAVLKKASLEEMFPSYTIGDVKTPLTRSCFIQADIDKNIHGLASLVHITAIDLGAKKVVDSQCLNSNVEALSMTPKSLYLTGSVYKGGIRSASTIIHKFDLTGKGLSYSATGSVPGSVGWRSDPAFRMHEYGDQFRIVTSNWEKTGPVHRLTILQARGKQLVQVSTIPNKENPAPIGKPREDIYSVRFEGNKAFIVTFLQTDPLYSIDLSDPKNPTVTGELEIPGFATYMHPVGENYLFTFGRDADENGRIRGLKAELIDVSGPSPEVVSSHILGGSGSSSIALNDLRAFSFQETDNNGLRVAIPVRIRNQGGLLEEGSLVKIQNYTGVQLFSITDIDGSADMENSGVAVIKGSANTYYSRGRTVLHDDALYISFGNDVWVAPWHMPKDVSGDACDATVNIFSNDGYQETLKSSRSNSGSECQFYGAGERAGHYLIEASLPNYRGASTKVTVYEDDCHVIPEKVAMTLVSQEPKFCTLEVRPSINLNLSASDGSSDICDAEVYVVQNGEPYPLELTGNFSSGSSSDTPIIGESEIRPLPPIRENVCNFQGPYELGGDMTLVIEHPNYEPVKEGIHVKKDECHVSTLKLDLELNPI